MTRVIAILSASVLSVAACSNSPVAEPDLDELPFGEASFDQVIVRTQYMGRAGRLLWFEVEYRNTGTVLEEFIASVSCPMLLVIFSNRERTGEPLWDARRDHGDCPAIGRTITLAPGGLYRLSYAVEHAFLVRDGLGGQHVFFSGIVELRGAQRSIPAGSDVIPRD